MEKTKQLRFRVRPEVHRAIKTAAAMMGISMHALVLSRLADVIGDGGRNRQRQITGHRKHEVKQ